MDVLNRMNDHVGSGTIPSVKGDAQATKDFVDEVIPELDHERVYNSDLKKLVQWFTILHENKAFPLENEMTEEEATKETSEAKPEKEAVAAKKANPKQAKKKSAAAAK
jgi:hypothetical protein